MNRTAAACCALALCLVAGSADSGQLTFGASAGPALVSGEGADRFRHGRWLQLDAVSAGVATNAWILRAAYGDFTSQAGSSLPFFVGGRLESARAPSGRPLRQTSLEAGLTRGFGSGVLRPRLEGLAGASWVEQPPVTQPFRNDRRPDPSLDAPAPSVRGHLVPALTLGAGVRFVTAARIGLDVSAAARWLPAGQFDGVIVPIRFGASWPAAAAAGPGESGSRPEPELRVSGGASFLRNPTRVRHEMTPSSTFAVAVELPLAHGLAFSLQGEHAADRDAAPLYLEQIDQFGNVVMVETGRSPLSVTLTALTFGLRASRPIGAVTISARAGAGWGRTGGFGSGEAVTVGYYPDGNVVVPIQQVVDYGAGDPATGFAYSVSAGAEASVWRSLGAFLEVGVLGAHLTRDDLLVVPLRMGVAIR
jgi:hypothetical protein